MIDTYRKQWQESKGFWHAVWRHIWDVLWWLMHVCGLNMVDYEERVLVLLAFVAVLLLILVGAYKQSTQLVHMLQQLVTSRLPS
ncbi:hypothetical protein OEZ85_011888 [Tetradesmus obliquus]|uniref:Uncharacterized protein n=1 Tax=Tetradesmus obliquus TaxID=3088 RepID=A0ABY8TU40_TETOB|nr:hypothetical protein OEZ85_011888 [Tetradesmus obliquus]